MFCLRSKHLMTECVCETLAPCELQPHELKPGRIARNVLNGMETSQTPQPIRFEEARWQLDFSRFRWRLLQHKGLARNVSMLDALSPMLAGSCLIMRLSLNVISEE